MFYYVILLRLFGFVVFASGAKFFVLFFSAGFAVFAVFLFVRFSRFCAEQVGKYAKDKRARYLRQFDFTEGHAERTYAGDKYNRYHEEIAIVAKVNLLYHFKTGYRDEAVECDAHTAHYTGGDSGKEGYERSKE